MAGVEGVRPVTGGVPIAEGAAPPGAAFALRDGEGKPVPLQSRVLAPWKDGSARWVLLDFQSAPPARGEIDYVLSWDGKEPSQEPAAAVVCEQGESGPAMRSGELTVSRAEDALVSIAERFDIVLALTDGDGQVCKSRVESAAVDTAGPMRSSLSLVGAFHRPEGDRVFQFRLRVSVYAGLSLLKVEPMILIDPAEGIIRQVRELRLVLRPRGGSAWRVRLGGEPGWEGDAAEGVRVFQYDDQNYRLEGAESEGGRAPGWGEIEDGSGKVAVALRELWQQWPKSVEASAEGLSIGLFPRFKEGDFAHMEPWYKYQWLFDGETYQLRTGQARGWEVWVEMCGDGEPLSRAVNAPLVPVADPAQAIATGVWDQVAPAGAPGMAEYDALAEEIFESYCRGIEERRDYGAMNWGDWFGERKVNWGNHEYDATEQVLIQFARTGDPKYFYVAQAAGRHSSEVDTIHYVNADLAEYYEAMKPRIEGARRPGMQDHGIDNVAGLHSIGYPPRAGMVHEHTIGHVGGFYEIDRVRELYIELGTAAEGRNPYLCLDPFNLGHVWTRGVMHQYFLTGDPFLRERVELVGANLAQLAEDREYQFMGHTHCGRIAGWTLQALSGAYESNLDERYLNAMKLVAEDAMDAQDRDWGGWLNEWGMHHFYLPTGKEQSGLTLRQGMDAFLTAILLGGLSRYCLLSGDERLPGVIDRALTFISSLRLLESAPEPGMLQQGEIGATAPGTVVVLVFAHINGIGIAGNDPGHIRHLRKSWPARLERLQKPLDGDEPAIGKEYSYLTYGCAEAAALLEAQKVQARR